MKYTFEEKIDIINDAAQILKECLLEIRSDSELHGKNIYAYNQEIDTIQKGYGYSNLAHHVLDIESIDENREKLKRRYSNNYIIEKGDIILEATKDLSQIKDNYRDYFTNKKITSPYFKTSNMSDINKTIDDILQQTKPSKNLNIPKKIGTYDKRDRKSVEQLCA